MTGCLPNSQHSCCEYQ